jgi:hypothetical protein
VLINVRQPIRMFVRTLLAIDLSEARNAYSMRQLIVSVDESLLFYFSTSIYLQLVQQHQKPSTLGKSNMKASIMSSSTITLSTRSFVHAVFIVSLTCSTGSAFLSPPQSQTGFVSNHAGANSRAVISGRAFVTTTEPSTSSSGSQPFRWRRHHLSSSSWTRQFATSNSDDEDDEDDDDDDDDDTYNEMKGPLADGVDSVSWLPSVIGGKGDNMPVTTKKEVRITELVEN